VDWDQNIDLLSIIGIGIVGYSFTSTSGIRMPITHDEKQVLHAMPDGHGAQVWDHEYFNEQKDQDTCQLERCQIALVEINSLSAWLLAPVWMASGRQRSSIARILRSGESEAWGR